MANQNQVFQRAKLMTCHLIQFYNFWIWSWCCSPQSVLLIYASLTWSFIPIFCHGELKLFSLFTLPRVIGPFRNVECIFMSVLIICFRCRLSVCLVGEIMVIDSNWSTLSFGRESSCGLWKNLESGAFFHLFSVRTELQWTGNHQCVTLKGWELYRNAWQEKQLNSPQLDRLSFSVFSVASH